MAAHVLDRPMDHPTGATLWIRTPGVDLLGEFQGGGWTEPHYLARRGDGQYANLTGLLYRLLEETEAPASAADLRRRLDAHLAGLGETADVDDIETMLRDQLAPAGMVMSSDRAPDAVALPRSDPLISLGLRGTLVPAPVVRAVSRPLAAMFHRPVVVLVLFTLAAADVWLFSHASVSGGLDTLISGPLLVVPLAVVSILLTFLHEFGHAAGCRFGGGRPGRVGFGVMIVWPVFFTDVTDTYRLSRAARIRTDLGGLYFDALGILIVIASYALTEYDVLALFVVVLHVSALEELLPVIRGDGYYLLGDVSGVPDPYTIVGPVLRGGLRGRADDPRLVGLRPRVRRVMRAWTLLVVPFIAASLALMAWALPMSIPRWVASVQMHWTTLLAAIDSSQAVIGTYAGASLLTLMVPVAGAAVLGGRLVRSVHRVARRHTSQPSRYVPRHRR